MANDHNLKVSVGPVSVESKAADRALERGLKHVEKEINKKK